MPVLSKEMSHIIGITGGIASGKSTVVKMIREAGYQVIDADKLVHDLQKKGGRLYQALLAHFGSSILDERGELNRSKLARIIFANSENLALSSQLQDSIIREELAKARDSLAKHEQVFFMDIPLLIEGGYVEWFDSIWLVYVDETTQLARLKKRNHYTDEEAHKRLDSQMSLAKKKAYADVIIDNNGSEKALKEQVDVLLAQLALDKSC